jgi:hypothetical protein
MVSEQLGLELVQQDDVLRLFDPLRGIFLPTDLEMAQRAEAEAERAETESQRAEAEAQARAEAEAEVARLRAELAALRGEKQAGTGAADG